MAQDTHQVDFRISATDGASAVFREAQRGLDGLAKQALDARAVLATLGATASAVGLGKLILDTTEAIAKYKDLGIVAGTTAANISAMEEPARLAGISLDSVAASVAKLGQSIGEARLGDVGKRSLLTALGVNVDDGRDAAEVYVDVARAVSGMADQTIAAKVSNDLLGKSYREVRVFLQELSEQGTLQSRITNEQAEAADRFRDNLARVSLSLDQVKINLGNELMPLLNELAQAFANNRKEMEGFLDVGAGVRTVFEALAVVAVNFAFTFRTIGGALTVTMAQIAALARGHVEDARLMQEAWEKHAHAARAEVDALSERILNAGKKIAEARDNWDLMGTQRTARGNEAEQRIRELTDFQKHYGERVAAARGFAIRYAEAIQLQNQLAQEAGKQGLLTDAQLIVQQAASEDARLQVMIRALEQERALHLQMGELKQARLAQDRAAAAESARIANDVITQARLTSLEAMKTEKDQAEAEAFRGKIFDQVEAIKQGNMTEIELLTRQLEDKTAILNIWAGEDLERQAEANRQRELLELQHLARLGDANAQAVLARRDFEQRTAKQRTQIVLNELQQMTVGIATASRTWFSINKAVGIATAIINTHEGVTKALAKYPPPLSFAMAALQLAAGMAQVQQMRNASFGSATSAPSIGGGTAIPVTTVEAAPPVLAQPISQQPIPAPQHQQVNITLVGRSFSASDVRELIESINEQQADGATIDVRVSQIES